MRINTKLFLSLGIACTVTACGSDSATVVEPDDAPTLTVFELTNASDAGSASLMNYSMPGVDGSSTRRENAVVVLPEGEPPEDGWPVIGWGHGTTGVADVCAPSATDNLAGYSEYLNAWLAAGYAIVAPDYEGLGTEGGHPFLHLDSEGRSINYAVEAAVEAIPELSSRYAVLGHSQGGHAVLGAASLADENPGVTLVAAVALAPASQVLAQGAFTESIYTDTTRPDAERISAAVGDLGFTTLLGHAIDTVIPSFDLDAAYGENGTELQQLTESTCLTEIREALAESVPPVLLANNNLDSFFAEDIETDPAVTTYFESVEPGNRAMAVPLLIAQGLADTTVFASSTATLLTQLSAVSDTDVDPLLNTYEGIGHGAILLASFNDAAAFIATQFATQADSE